MRKLILFLVILCALTLVACQQEDIETPIESQPTEPIPTEPVVDPIEAIFDASTSLTNYTLTIDIYHQSDIYTTIIKVTDGASSLTIDDQTEFVTNESDVCTHVMPSTDGYITEVIDCQDEMSLTYGFFESFEKSWFTEIENIYYLNLQNYAIIQAFFEQALPGMTVSNVELILGETYFEQLKLDLQNEDLLYRLDMVFSDIGETIVDVPDEG